MSLIKNYMKKLIHYVIIWMLICMFAFIVISLFKPDILLPIIEWIKSQVEGLWRWNYLLVFTSSLWESLPIIGTIVPGQLIMISVWWFYGALSSSNFIGVMICAMLWSIISNAIWFILGKHYWESFFEKYGYWVWIQKTELKYLKKWVNEWGPWAILLSKFHPHARAFLPFIAGSMWFSSRKFWLYNFIASAIWASVFIVIWVFFAAHYEIIIKYIWYVMMAILAGVGVYLWIFKKDWLKKYWEEKKKEIEKESKK